jgi:hypothetical protein
LSLPFSFVRISHVSMCALFPAHLILRDVSH